MNILILGGTTEASALCRALDGHARFRPLLSLAGRTRTPMLPGVPHRTGGFGGAEGLAEYLRHAGVAAVVDATHPFAARISANAALAATLAGVPRLAILRPPWPQRPGDDWRLVPGMADAAAALGPTPRRVFLTIGQQDLAAFHAAPQHEYLVRSIEPPATLPPRARWIGARGPFEVEAERALLARHRIEVLVTKQSGGPATEAKLHAARELHLPVVMVVRPATPPPPVVPGVDEAIAWLNTLPAPSPAGGRGLG